MTGDVDNSVRVALYRLAVETQRLPSAEEVAAELGLNASAVVESFARLADAHVIVPSPEGRVRMAMPFSGVPTSVRVVRDGKSWWANCAWDALGIPAAIDGGVALATIETTCGDCGEAITLSVGGGRAFGADPRLEPVVHFAVPAARWWDDIGFT